MKDLFRLDGKTAVVVGGGGGIGQAIAEGFAFYGARVVIAGRNPESLDKAAAAIYEETGSTVFTHVVDVENKDSVELLVSDIEEQVGPVDILVNSRGVNIKKSVFDMTTEDWDKTFAVNVRGVMLCSVAFARRMCGRRSGRIINFSSVRGYGAAAGNGLAFSYSSSKGAVNMLTKQLSAELAEYGVTVNAISPAATKTAAAGTTAAIIPDIEKRLIAKIPLGRMAMPEDMIGAAVLLASDAGAYITGSNIYVDGGMTSVC